MIDIDGDVEVVEVTKLDHDRVARLRFVALSTSNTPTKDERVWTKSSA